MKKHIMIDDKQIIGKTLKECMDDITKSMKDVTGKLDNHIAHTARQIDLLENNQITLKGCLNTLKNEIRWVKWISVTVLLSVIGMGFCLATKIIGG